MKLKDRVAIITGAGRGIGRAYALRFAEEGAKIVIPDINFENAQNVTQEIIDKGGEAIAVHTDVTNESSVKGMAAEVAAKFGHIDILINNAAIIWVDPKPWDALSVKDWEEMLAVNLIGVWLCTKAVVPHMKAHKNGKIINIHSSVAELGYYQALHYACSKGAIDAMTKALAKALGRHNINVNAISPGLTLAEAAFELTGGREMVEGMMKQVASQRCFKRTQVPEDLVGTAVFLASEDSSFITGQIICVDGGDVFR